MSKVTEIGPKTTKMVPNTAIIASGKDMSRTPVKPATSLSQTGAGKKVNAYNSQKTSPLRLNDKNNNTTIDSN